MSLAYSRYAAARPLAVPLHYDDPAFEALVDQSLRTPNPTNPKGSFSSGLVCFLQQALWGETRAWEDVH